MKTWLRRNGIALLSLAVLVPLTVWLVSSNEAYRFTPTKASAPISVASGDTAEYVGATFGPASGTEFPDDAAPAGSHVVDVTLPVQDGLDIDCGAPALVEVGTGRRWIGVNVGGLDFFDERPYSCYGTETADYELGLTYLVPDGAGPFTLDVSSLDGVPAFLRFDLDL